jgi:O-antigen/teichoic acid export membrane protein
VSPFALLKQIAKGAGWKLSADLVARILQYALLWIAARSLAQADYGDFTFGLSIGLMLAQVADFGLQLYTQRELARLTIPGAIARPYFTDESHAARLIGGGLLLKGLLSLASMVILAGVVYFEPVGNKGALLLVGFAAVLGTLLDYFSYCFRALGRLQNEAKGLVIARATNLALGVGALILGGGVLGLAIAGDAAMLLGVGYLYSRLRKYIVPVWHVDRPYWRRVLAQPTAIGIGIVFSTVSFRVDNLLIPPIVGREALAAYNVAYKLFEPSQILPGVLLAATFPLIARAAATEKKEDDRPSHSLRSLLGQNLALLCGLGIAVTAVLFLLASPVTRLLYGDLYTASVPMLRVLALAALPMYLNYMLTHTLIALDRPRLYALATLCALVVNVLINLALIPSLGAIGAAWATGLTEVALLVVCASCVAWSLAVHRAGTPQPVGELEGMP